MAAGENRYKNVTLLVPFNQLCVKIDVFFKSNMKTGRMLHVQNRSVDFITCDMLDAKLTVFSYTEYLGRQILSSSW